MSEDIFQNEVWKPIEGYPATHGYAVSSLGRVKNCNGIRKLTTDSNGYLYVPLTVNRVSKIKRVHQLVAQAFLKNPEGHRVVNHFDKDRQNNKLENLEWCSSQENAIHGCFRQAIVVYRFGKYSCTLPGGAGKSRKFFNLSQSAFAKMLDRGRTDDPFSFSRVGGNRSRHMVMVAPDTEWKDVPGAPLYEVSRCSLVRHKINGTFLTPSKARYASVRLQNGEKSISKMLHRVVAEAWLPAPPPEKTQVNHIDGNTHNNHLSNLEFVTPAENVRHAAEVLERMGTPILQIDPTSRKVMARFPTIQKAAKHLGVAGSSIPAVLCGQQKVAYGFFWKAERSRPKITAGYNPVRRSILQIDRRTRKVLFRWSSLAAAAVHLGHRNKRAAVRRALQGKIKHSLNFRWEEDNGAQVGDLWPEDPFSEDEEEPDVPQNEPCEIWRRLPKHLGDYEVSSQGRFRHRHQRHVLLRTKVRDGRRMVRLLARRERSRWILAEVGRLVAKAFIPNPHKFASIRYKDGDAGNNSFENLSWVLTRSRSSSAQNHVSITVWRYGRYFAHHRTTLKDVAETYQTSIPSLYKKLAIGQTDDPLSFSRNGPPKPPLVADPDARWKDVPEFPNYQVSNTGQARNKITNALLRPNVRLQAYPLVTLYNQGIPRSIKLHRLVGELWVPRRDSTCTVLRHKDGNAHHNHAANLEWVTPFEAQKRSSHWVTPSKDGPKSDRRVPVLRVDPETKETVRFDSMRQAALALGKPHGDTKISDVVYGVASRAYNYFWKLAPVEEPVVQGDESVEEWRHLPPPFPVQYQVSNKGAVRDRFGNSLEATPDARWHRSVLLQIGADGKEERFKVQHLVAYAFLGNPQGLVAVNHKNKNLDDNRAVNLEWVSDRADSTEVALPQKIVLVYEYGRHIATLNASREEIAAMYGRGLSLMTRWMGEGRNDTQKLSFAHAVSPSKPVVPSNAQWRVVQTHTKYEVSSCGLIRNRASLELFANTPNRERARVGLRNSTGQKDDVLVQDAVAKAWLPDDPSLAGQRVCLEHIDGNLHHNAVSNLRWITFSQNRSKATRAPGQEILQVHLHTRQVLDRFSTVAAAAKKMGNANHGAKILAVLNGHQLDACGFDWKRK